MITKGIFTKASHPIPACSVFIVLMSYLPSTIADFPRLVREIIVINQQNLSFDTPSVEKIKALGQGWRVGEHEQREIQIRQAFIEYLRCISFCTKYFPNRNPALVAEQIIAIFTPVLSLLFFHYKASLLVHFLYNNLYNHLSSCSSQTNGSSLTSLFPTPTMSESYFPHSIKPPFFAHIGLPALEPPFPSHP